MKEDNNRERHNKEGLRANTPSIQYVRPLYLGQAASCVRQSKCINLALGHNRIQCNLYFIAFEPHQNEWYRSQMGAGFKYDCVVAA
mmetsp:Transcript_13298/g.22177  ORF Transcript_13298/g.22177 Transcript_13298/m.22177 type:complete len:86 (+) Transcript_13298:340-597(+)